MGRQGMTLTTWVRGKWALLHCRLQKLSAENGAPKKKKKKKNLQLDARKTRTDVFPSFEGAGRFDRPDTPFLQ
jgi:hypothetical protein